MNTQELRPTANMVVRGKIYSDNLIEVGGRGGDMVFLTPDVHKYRDVLPLGSPGKLADLYELSFDDILDYLEALGEALDVDKNPKLRRAMESSYPASPMSPTLVDASYEDMRWVFQRDIVRELADTEVGIPYLEGWVESERIGGVQLGVRCFGARTVNVVAGNAPIVSAITVVRNAILRSDTIIKAPSNDPFTALAIAETMCEIAPDHPITKHLSVAYWRGGDEKFEEFLYQPQNIEKIIACGGFAAVKHVTQYIQPGLELISLDPKRSMSIVGQEAFDSEDTMWDVARRIATDVGGYNQVQCANARVVYVVSGTDDAGLERINRLGEMVQECILKLPPQLSTKPKKYDQNLKASMDALRLTDMEWYKLIGEEDDGAAVIVSQLPNEVEFATLLNDRVANLVPIDSVDEAIQQTDSYTQTVGVYPEELKSKVMNIQALYGSQRYVSLGYALSGCLAKPQDGLEVVRRMGKWVTNEISDPEKVPPLWETSY